ncbi:MAG: hypothetical protein AAGN35_26610 [Bacteroidota bacterium]
MKEKFILLSLAVSIFAACNPPSNPGIDRANLKKRKLESLDIELSLPPTIHAQKIGN